MSAVDEAIALRRRARGPAGERRTFTLARARAIHKLREFALADPHHYILELIQAAVAQGASRIDLTVDTAGVTFTCTGAAFREGELGQLFDFLFTGRDRPDLGHVRELALGVNTLLSFSPTRVAVVSGDGTLEGSTRLVLTHGAERVEVGRPDAPMKGTVIWAEGLDRGRSRLLSALAGRSYIAQSPELLAIEERCLTAPVPIIVNDEPVFGYGSFRLPTLPGYDRTLGLDEGDLYGRLGVGHDGLEERLKLLTYGVWIESAEPLVLPDGQRVGGVICFDRLHKTVDHTGIVRDRVWDELLIRLTPYAQQLADGRTRATAVTMTLLSGEVLSIRALRLLLRGTRRVCLVPPEMAAASPAGGAARVIGEALGCPVLRARPDERAWIRALAGPATALLSLDAGCAADVPFFVGQTLVDAPPRPWLVEEMTADALSMDALLERVRPWVGPRTSLAELEGLGDVRVTVHTPAARGVSGGVTVRLVTVDRLVGEWTRPSAHPGHVVTVHLPDMSPRVLARPAATHDLACVTLGDLVAQEMAALATPTMARAGARAIDVALGAAGSGPPPPGIRALAVAALDRAFVWRVTTSAAGTPRLRLSVLGEDAPEALLSAPLFPTVGGGFVSMARIGELIEAQGGLVYGTLPEVPADLTGLDAGEILALEPELERRLLMLVGGATYVRVDQRDVLAEHQGVVCRDLALGLRRYPDFPLLVEGVDPTGWPADAKLALVGELVGQLVARVVGGRAAGSAPPAASDHEEEDRRQALRHLQWFVCHRDPHRFPGFGADELPLFLDAEDRAYAFADLKRALRRPRGLSVALRRAMGGPELGLLARAIRQRSAGEEAPPERAPAALLASPFVCALLSRHEGVRFGAHHPLPHEPSAGAAAHSEGAAPPGDAFVHREPVRGLGLVGRVGVPADPSVPAEVTLLAGGRDARYAFPEAARRFGMTGLVRLEPGQDLDDDALARVEEALDRAGERLVVGLLERLPELPPQSPAGLSALLRLLAFAAEHLQLATSWDGALTVDVGHPLAVRVLDLPTIPGPDEARLPARALLEEFARRGGQPLPATTLCADAPPALVAWVQRVLHPARIIRPAVARAPLPPLPVARADHPDDERVAAAVERWLQQLRPDLPEEGGGGSADASCATRAPYHVVARRGADLSRPASAPAHPHLRYVEARRGGALSAGPAPTPPLMRVDLSEDPPVLTLNADHWLFVYARERAGDDPTALAALLLGCYAQVNAILDPITNRHEQAFQRRLIDALEMGTLELG